MLTTANGEQATTVLVTGEEMQVFKRNISRKKSSDREWNAFNRVKITI
jgi:hypothetical protein